MTKTIKSNKKRIVVVGLLLVFAFFVFASGYNDVATVQAAPSTHKVYVDGTKVNVSGYNIGGNNYFKLRDIAMGLKGSGKEINIGWDGNNKAISIIPDTPYQPVGGELTPVNSGTVNATPSTAKVYFNGASVNLTGYNIAGNNFYKVRDVADLIGVEVEWDGTTFSMNLITRKTNNDTPVGETLKTVSNNPGYSYNTSLLDRYAASTSEERKKMFDAAPEKMLCTWELAMVDRVNEERRKAGVNELVIDEDIMAFSKYWAKHLTTNYKHSTRSDSRNYAKSVSLSDEVAAKVRNVGENIAMSTGFVGDKNPMEFLMNILWNSEGHRITMLYSDYKTIGIGFAMSSTGGLYCCQNFGY